ncbi:ATP-binding cassette domain-containing protein [Granulosicoccus antarcticus]|uniref:Putative ABC transporter ATP-binding protein YbhF n=1 Tax=Granulosicoccus antarcticus IMCC3135 TaxID=1192854 RepID=A0A2Z2NV42_9GAMM|nr:ATP-binding cassette domain-containing protein [Granulosicoccus antarcticus]ASJ72660.1 putative ABC transporter ATP-binding protein YbhF [Granulosicoccus antarcticus IMCC3135]
MTRQITELAPDCGHEPAIVIRGVVKRFKSVTAIRQLDVDVLPGRLTGLVGPDGAGKTTLLRMLAALMAPDEGLVRVMGHDVVTAAEAVHCCIGYMPQRFGLYEDLSVAENLKLYADLKDVAVSEQSEVFDRLYDFTRLKPFAARRAGNLSGGMKQKLGLACALMGKPDVLLLDEPSVGVDPVSRQELWRMVQELAGDGMAVIWATAYLDEAERCESVLLLEQGSLLFAGAPQELTSRLAGRSYRVVGIQGDRRALLSSALALPAVCDGVIQGDSVRLVRTPVADQSSLQRLAEQAGARLEPVLSRFEDAFIDLLGGGPDGHSLIAERMQTVDTQRDVMVECSHLTRRFGDFVATDDVSFSVKTGEVFGLLGPNGAGKSTTFRMLCGLLRPSEGVARVAGHDLVAAPAMAKSQLGYMAQKFSLYGLLSVRQNLDFFSGAYGLRGPLRRQRIEEMIDSFQLGDVLNVSPESLPLGFRQRLALACALMHRPSVLFLDEPTSGVDPVTRREFWTHISGLVKKRVTVMVTTHFMDEAEYCDRIALMQNGKLVKLDTPDALKAMVVSETLPEPTMEEAFIRLVGKERGGVES